ncbi:c-type cytochrome [Cupriavidus pinatubonensis]|uniref:c-type cytochrome n=1 Tax=Cupriavidus pinatubonensis TaxID=248026 RepID=UPI00215A073C|nr:cytochrome c [Cupriavidus pinatubonensis]
MKSALPRWSAWLVLCAALAAMAGPAAHGQSLPAGDADAYRNYVLHCMGCHGARGDGVPGKIPPLKGALGLFVHSDAGRQFIVRVPGASTSALTDAELAAVTNLLLERFSAKELPANFQPYTEAEVSRMRRPAFTDVAKVRHDVISDLRRDGVPLRFDY